MSKWDKLLAKILTLSNDVRFRELQNILEEYGYIMTAPSGGSSHYIFRKKGCNPITIPKHEPIKLVYVKRVKQVVEADDNENT
ncbi:MAG: type II toxin-antitoxin system HicA family toxin [Acidaminococcaceae bacterium]|nr:type II toxin-antitoxin system HicA family toxin [Acidaminococcaceae bacterium]